MTQHISKAFVWPLALGLATLTACGSLDEPDPNNLVTKVPSTAHQTAFDKWLEKSLLTPYNIQLQYRLNNNELDLSYPVVPASEAQSIRFAHILRHACLESYDEATGSTAFIRTTFPKLLQIVGSFRYSGGGTADEGVAEGGRKMTLFGINEIDFKNVDAMQQTFKTLHHEFTHVQNQVKAYPKEFRSITSTGYVGETWTSKWANDTGVYETVITQYETERVKALRRENTKLKATHDSLTAVVKGLEAAIQDLTNYVATLPDGDAKTAIEADLASRKAELLATQPHAAEATEAYSTQKATMEADPEYKTWVAVGTRALYYYSTDGYATLNALRAGFISPYASATPDEDFAELQAFYIMETADAWDTILKIAGPGAPLISQKIDIVRSYLSTQWQLDLDRLREVVHRREAELPTLDIDNISH